MSHDCPERAKFPRGSRSASISITDAFLETYTSLRPEVVVDTLNVWQEDLPDFDQEAIDAKYKGVSHATMTAQETELWGRIQTLAKRFQAADRIVVGVPMWNFAYPYKLKQMIDLVSQRNLLFSFEKGRFGPLLAIPRALVVYTRGQTYLEGSPMPSSQFNHQTGYIEFWLKLIGVQQIQTITTENTWSDQAAQRIENAQVEARALAKSF